MAPGDAVVLDREEWGRMLADARTYFFLAPHLLMYPGRPCAHITRFLPVRAVGG